MKNDEYWDYQAMTLPKIDDQSEHLKSWRKIRKVLDESKEKGAAKVFMLSVPKGFDVDKLNSIKLDSGGKLDLSKQLATSSILTGTLENEA